MQATRAANSASGNSPYPKRALSTDPTLHMGVTVAVVPLLLLLTAAGGGFLCPFNSAATHLLPFALHEALRELCNISLSPGCWLSVNIVIVIASVFMVLSLCPMRFTLWSEHIKLMAWK